MISWTASLAGLVLTIAGVGETFMAVLYPRAMNGPITTAINRAFHAVLNRDHFARSRFVVAVGPTLVVTQVLCWAALILLGVSLIVWPQLSTGITATGSNPTDTDFSSAIYYAGFTITTLGVGDLVPRTPAMQFLTITAAGLGFSFFTLVLAYVISIYSTLARRNQFANEIDYRTGRTGNSTSYLRAYLTDSDPSLINQDLYALSSNMAELLESHHFYPALHFFRFAEPRYSMSQMLQFCLEVASVMRAVSQVDSCKASANSEAVNRLWHASMQMLEDTKRNFVICDSTQEDPNPQLVLELAPLLDESREARNQFEAAYIAQQSKWLHDLNALANCTKSER